MRRVVTVALVAVTFLGACGSQDEPGLANPASRFCEDRGGQVEIRTTGDGEVGYCLFPDGSECEEWAYYRGECNPGG